MGKNSGNITRRSFVGKTGAVAAGLTIIPGSVINGMNIGDRRGQKIW